MNSAKTYLGTLRGYRKWWIDVRFDVYTLNSLSYGGYWDSPNLTANCKNQFRNRKGSHKLDDAPYPYCTCGIYGFYSPGMAKDFWVKNESEDISTWYPMGVISAHGKIILHDYGFRAEHVHIEAIALEGRILKNPEIAKDLLDKYSGMKIFTSCDDMISEFPPEPLPFSW